MSCLKFCFQVTVHTRMNPRGRLRRRRRAATETVDDRIRGPKSGRVQCRYSLQKPVFERFFRVLTVFSSIDLVQKCSVIFCDIKQTTDRISARSPGRGSRFSTSKTALLPQVAQKSGSEASRSILLTSSLKSSSGASLVGTRSKLRLRRKKVFRSQAGVTSHVPRGSLPP